MACPAPANVWANSGYSSGLGDWLRERCGVVPEIVARQAGHEGFVPLPRRWIVADRDVAAQVARSLVESTLGSLVMAFQRYAEALYLRLPSSRSDARPNAFQNLDEGSRLWEEAGGRPYGTIVGPDAMARLRRMFQQRHLLAHREGVVDQKYIDRTGDTSYGVGQRLVIREHAVLTLTADVAVLVSGLNDDMAQLSGTYPRDTAVREGAAAAGWAAPGGGAAPSCR